MGLLDPSGLVLLRRAFARQITALGGGDARLEAAFAAVPREGFLGPQPWTLFRPGGRPVVIDDGDVLHAYQDVLVSLDAARLVNNGSPALHASLLAALSPRQGQRVVHLGAGTGYYSAILAELVGPAGEVVAVEMDTGLADIASRQLSPWPQARVVVGSDWPLGVTATDAIYVNYGTAEPDRRWLTALSPEGRVVFPLCHARPGAGARFAHRGVALLVVRAGPGFEASSLGPAFFVMTEVGGNVEGEAALARAFEKGGVEFVRSLHLGNQPDPARCWFWSPHWSLCYDPP